MSLAQDIRNAFDSRSSDDLELALLRVVVLEKIAPKKVSLICSKCGINRLDSPCPIKSTTGCPASGTVLP